MKRVTEKFSGVIRSQRFHKILILVAVFSSGVAVGFVCKSFLIKDDKPQPNTVRPNSQIAEDRAKRSSQRLEESYKRAQERVKSDVQAKRLEQKKADEISKKLEEIYNYRKSNQNDSSAEKREELQQKRKEWREWLEKNEVSSRYFIGVI